MSCPHFYSLAFFLTTISLNHVLSSDASSMGFTDCYSHVHPYKLSARHIEQGGIGYDQGYTTFEGFFASDPAKVSVLPFLDLRGHVFNDGKLAANAGFGVRGFLQKRLYGFNAYYDYRNSQKLHYNQVGLGLETLGTFWDCRLNGYLPVGRKITSPYKVKFAQFLNHSAIVSQKRQFAMKGLNADVGFHFGKSKHFDFYTSIGPYYFIGEIGSNIWGAKARLLGKYKDYIQLELSNSYDKMFGNRFQGQLTFSIPLGPKAHLKNEPGFNSCKASNALLSRIMQPVIREEIVVVGKAHQKTPAINPLTGLPYYFVFVNNTGHSDGSYQNPYHDLSTAEANSSPYDVIYIFPGDGTTIGMNSGITLKNYQKLWGSGKNQILSTPQAEVIIPAQTTTSPQITNTNFETDGHAIILSQNNSISGLNISNTIADAIIGSNVSFLELLNCNFQNIGVYTLEATASAQSNFLIKNNQFVNNTNGISLDLLGTSSVVCQNNLFQGQTSSSSIPLAVSTHQNSYDFDINNNIFNNNEIGSVIFNLNNTSDQKINFFNNIISNNRKGSSSALGSSFIVLSNGTISHCEITMTNNSFTNNSSNAVYFHTSGFFQNCSFTASNNIIANNSAGGLAFATPAYNINFIATNNVITNSGDNGIGFGGTVTNGTLVINNNTITNIGTASSGINIGTQFTTCDFTTLNNYISNCDGSGILIYANPLGNSLTLNIANNTINNCQNSYSNLGSGLAIGNYTNIHGVIANNSLNNNTTSAVYIGESSVTENICITLSGNQSADYTLDNAGGGIFSVSPMNYLDLNSGIFTNSGTITPVNACPVLKK